MDTKRYRKTRYQNIFRNIKNGNYIVRISNPDTTISKDRKGNKIYDINLAKDIRDNKSNHIIKTQQINNKDAFEKVWSEYIEDCKEKLAYNTYHKKIKLYKAHFKNYFDDMKISKIEKIHVERLLSNLKTTNLQKNEILIQLRGFFNWCIKRDIILINPTRNIPKLPVENHEMKYWLPEHLKKVLDVLDNDIKNDINKSVAYTIKIFILLAFNLGARTGEIRALRFCDVANEYKIISISHSIEYDPKSDSYLKDTKNKHSKRKIEVSEKLITELQKYKSFLTNDLKMNITDDSIILINPNTKRPFSDVVLRKYFYDYIEKANVPKIRMYDLRHTHVTTMMTEGFEIYAISKRIGHNNINTTVNTYGHISEKIRREMANSIDKYY